MQASSKFKNGWCCRLLTGHKQMNETFMSSKKCVTKGVPKLRQKGSVYSKYNFIKSFCEYSNSSSNMTYPQLECIEMAEVKGAIGRCGQGDTELD